MSMENHGRMISTLDSSTRALWKSYEQNNLVARQDGLAKEIMNLTYEIFI
jgi:hypothetical protein